MSEVTNPSVKKSKYKYRVSIRQWIRENPLVFGIAIGVILVIASSIFVSLQFLKGIPIGSSIIRDVNITLISTMATLLGLYVTAFIFLNDSLKTRSHDDNTLSEAINKILGSCRLKMLGFSILTIIAIVSEVIYNVLLGNATNGNNEVENIIVHICDELWWCFIALSALSIVVIAVIICASRDIMDSDRLIRNQAQHNLNKHGATLLELYDALNCPQTLAEPQPIGSNDRIYNPLYYIVEDSIRPNQTRYEGLPPLNAWQQQHKDQYRQKIICDFVDTITSDQKKYTLASAKRAIEIDQRKLSHDGNTSSTHDVNATSTQEDFIINLGKTVRLIEMIILRICDNNIDRSIMSGSLVVESMESGFKWLYARESSNDATILDVRDEHRFLDYLKYQLLCEPHYADMPFDNNQFERDFDILSKIFFDMNFGKEKGASDATSKGKPTKRYIIQQYKETMRELITQFFHGYRCLIGYRDALVHFDRFKDNKKHKKSQQETLKIIEDQKHILEYAEILKRTLIDRFTSFVKVSDLNLGNSTLVKGWFNYSELSDSNFTHSSFRFARIENAILRNCDLSTCNFIGADASNTDFSHSNFSYSNLTGMDLSECVLNNAQMNSILLRDERIDGYHKGLRSMFEDAGKETDQLPNKGLFASQRHILREGSFAINILRDSCKADQAVPIDNWFQFGHLLSQSLGVFDGVGDAKNDSPMARFFDYRKHSKISKEDFAVLKEVRESEVAQQKKDERETQYGKIHFSVARLEAASINDVSMKDTDFSHVVANNASFRDSDLSSADMYYTAAQSAMFYRTNLNELDAYRARFDNANFNEASLIDAVFTDCALAGCNFKKAIMIGSVIINNLQDYSRGKAIMDLLLHQPENRGRLLTKKLSTVREGEIVIEGLPDSGDALELPANCVDCEFDEAIANNLALVNCNMQRSNFRSASLRDCFMFNLNMRRCEFGKADLSNCTAYGVSFFQAGLQQTRMSMAKIFMSDFVGANLNETNFTSATIERTIFEETNLDECNLSSATISHCTFNCCTMKKTILTNTHFENVTFVDCDFRATIGLKQAVFKQCVFVKADGTPETNIELALTKQVIIDRDGEIEQMPVYTKNRV